MTFCFSLSPSLTNSEANKNSWQLRLKILVFIMTRVMNKCFHLKMIQKPTIFHEGNFYLLLKKNLLFIHASLWEFTPAKRTLSNWWRARSKNTAFCTLQRFRILFIFCLYILLRNCNKSKEFSLEKREGWKRIWSIFSYIFGGEKPLPGAFHLQNWECLQSNRTELFSFYSHRWEQTFLYS